MPSGILPDAGLHSGVDGQRRLPRLAMTGGLARRGVLAAAAVLLVTAPVRGGFAVFAGLPAGVLAAARSAALAALVVLTLLFGWARRSLRGLPAPLRYGCSVDPFVPARGSATPAGAASLHHDLAHALATRYPRLAQPSHGAAEAGDTHTVHVGGFTLVRGEEGGHTSVEVQPSVRIGPGGPAAGAASHDRVGVAGAATPATVAMAGDDLTPDEYATLLDRVRASVAEELYRQLEEHVTDQLASLPTRYLRGRAIRHEADDHARSGTAAAHDRARRLYDLAAERLDLGARPLPPTLLRRAGALTAGAASRGFASLRRVGARVFPRLADRDVVWARCQLGSAAALLDRRVLSGTVGRQLTAVYEAQPLVRSALTRLASLPAEAPGRDAALFDGEVLLGSTLLHLGDRPAARRHLDRARAADPSRAEVSPAYLLAAGELDERPESRTRRLGQAATLEPGGGPARWRAAQERERVWRTADVLDATEAESVIAGYRTVLGPDPGHLGAWAGIGHVHWLLGQLGEAQATFRSAGRARPLGAGTFRTEFDLGRARIAAESGLIGAAYQHTGEAVAGLLAEGVLRLPHGELASYGAWCYAGSPAILDRCRAYRERVTANLEEAHDAGRWSPAVLDRVDAFVWYDLGECLRAAGGTEEAEHAFLRATTADPGFVLAHLQLGSLHRRQGDEERAALAVEELARRDPSWEAGALARAFGEADRAARARRRAARAVRTATARAVGRSTLEERRLVSTAAPAPAHEPPAETMSLLAAAGRAGPGYPADAPPAAPGGSQADGARQVAGREEAVPDAAFRPPGAVLAAELQRLDDEIGHERHRSEQQVTQARLAATSVRAIVPALVPHQWLWQRPDGDDGFDWLALNPPDPRHERRWERQLNERHAVALFLYAQTWLRHPPEGVREELAFQRAAALLRCLRERFLPRDRAVLADLLVAEAAVGARDRVTDLVADIAGGTDEQARKILAEVCADDNEHRPDWQADILVAACEQDGFSPGLSAWMADQAITRVVPRVDADRGKRLTAAAGTAFRRGLRSRRADDLLLAGDGLSELCDVEHAARAYRAVRDGDGAAGTDAGIGREGHAHRAATRLAAIEFLTGDGTLPDDEVSPGSDGGALTRWEVARAIGEELAQARRRPCADAASLDAGYEYARLWVAAERQSAARADDAEAWRDAEAARLALVAARPPASVAMWHRSDATPPHADPRIAVETRSDFPDGAGPGARADTSVFQAAAEDARREIGRRFGLRMPPVAWRHGAGDLPPGGYRFVLDGVPVAAGRVEHDGLFLPAPEGSLPARLLPAEWEGDSGGRAGRWVRSAGAPDHPVHWTPAQYLGRHLATCLQERLTAFLGVQEVREALERWVAAGGPEERDRASAAAALRRGPELRTLTVCLRALVSERVPVRDLGPLVDAYRHARPDAGSLREVVARLRQSVRDRLPGNTPGWQRLRLGEDLERDIRRYLPDGDPPTGSPDVVAALLAGVREAIGPVAREPVAVVTAASLRFGVRWLVAVDRPWVPVLAEEEVVTAIRLPDDGPSTHAEGSGVEWTR